VTTDPRPAGGDDSGDGAAPPAPAARTAAESAPTAAPAETPAAEAAAPPQALAAVAQADEPAAPAAAAEPAESPPEPAAPASRPFVRRHHWIVRLTHWVNTVVLIGMVASGLQIYNAYERFGIVGTRLPLPNPLDMHAVPRWARLGGWLAGGINWHFFLMWPLVLNGLLYLGYLVASREWRSLAFSPRDVKPAIAMQKYYLRLRKEHPPQGKHNALQKAAYSFILVLGVLSVLSGLALWKPVQLHRLTAAFGGYELARYWNFVAVWLFVAFILVHVTLVFVADPASLRAMITGWYRGRFPSHD
jgi:thiosulfate reductase cytochrome b subunit